MSSQDIRKGVRQEDVAVLASAILADSSMNLPMIPDAVESVIYQSTVKLTFNMFYKAISNLDGMDLVMSSTTGESQRQLKLNRVCIGTDFISDRSAQQQQKEWRAFQSSFDKKPIQQLAKALIQNKAVNMTVVPDAVEEQAYVNCLKIVFWVLNLISSNVKITFCGHILSMDILPASSMVGRRGGTGRKLSSSFMANIDSFVVNSQTIRGFCRQANALLSMDGHNPMETSTITDKKNSGAKTGLAWMRSSLNKVQKEMIKQLNTSLYGLILAIVDDMLKCTTIDILSDQISLRVASPSSSGKNHAQVRKMKDDGGGDSSCAVLTSLESLGFEEERVLLKRRFRDWSLEEKALILQDLQSQM